MHHKIKIPFSDYCPVVDSQVSGRASYATFMGGAGKFTGVNCSHQSECPRWQCGDECAVVPPVIGPEDYQ